ncbi:uncharacterized protein LOC126821757 [Patella vulgata]|uniref:uncharacterized protein LOC126821757 n=1 Tax=Patella vulgata TaxID=6465 RepID=UPI00217FFB84|nr:uncharacterized protein LOC126821757 [Patella vulgata]
MSVLTWGLGVSGQLGSGDKLTQHIPVSVKFFAKETPNCRLISCGGLFTSILTDDGRVFTSGCCKYGRLGNVQVEDEVVFKEVKPLGKQHKQISSGIWHGATVTSDNNLCVWGHGKASGINQKTSIPPTISPSIRVTGVSCGFNFTLAWSLEGQAYSFGSGHFGVLGHGSLDNVSSPRLIASLSKYNIVSMSAGYSHSGAITQDGKLFMFGKGADGALGLGEENRENKMEAVEVANDSICFKTVSCSVGEHHGHTLATSSEGGVYSWGDGYKGKLGHGDQGSRFLPTKIDPAWFDGDCIIQVASGGIHSCALSSEGHVFTWGCGSDGRLGHPEGKGHRYLFRSDTPKIVEELLKYKVLQVSCSYYHTAAIVERMPTFK